MSLAGVAIVGAAALLSGCASSLPRDGKAQCAPMAIYMPSAAKGGIGRMMQVDCPSPGPSEAVAEVASHPLTEDGPMDYPTPI